MLGHHLYNENKKRAILNNKKLPSYTILSIDLLNELLREKMSTGNLILSDERFDLKEIINFNQIIGKIH
ncbi:TPA: phage head morphogenesis protein, partial [Staphylococcus aureus]|nr:phage head morphogenesis protein [Staphylococcus aureus]